MAEENNSDKRSVNLRELLETVPPYEWVDVLDLAAFSNSRDISEPEIMAYCKSEICQDFRYFDCERVYSYIDYDKITIIGFYYCCRHCKNGHKWFSLLTVRGVAGGTRGEVVKLGEWPLFGDPIPPRVITLVETNRELFLKGKRSEDQGLGIGAFTYYRRVVENQWKIFLDEIIKVSKHLKRPEGQIRILETAKTETQFNRAVESIKDAIPESLLIDGHHNPLTVLHQALSKGVHELSDEECLDRAKSIRLVLFELSERLSQAKKEHSELRKAITKLFSSDKTPKTDSEQDDK